MEQLELCFCSSDLLFFLFSAAFVVDVAKLFQRVAWLAFFEDILPSTF